MVATPYISTRPAWQLRRFLGEASLAIALSGLLGLLPGRTHIVVTTNPHYQAEGIHVVHSISDAIQFAREQAVKDGTEEAFVIGGAALYAAALPLADRFHLTRVHAIVDGDTSLAQFDERNWLEVSRVDYLHDDSNPFDYSICVLERVRS